MLTLLDCQDRYDGGTTQALGLLASESKKSLRFRRNFDRKQTPSEEKRISENRWGSQRKTHKRQQNAKQTGLKPSMGSYRPPKVEQRKSVLLASFKKTRRLKHWQKDRRFRRCANPIRSDLRQNFRRYRSDVWRLPRCLLQHSPPG